MLEFEKLKKQQTGPCQSHRNIVLHAFLEAAKRTIVAKKQNISESKHWKAGKRLRNHYQRALIGLDVDIKSANSSSKCKAFDMP
jgi:hypothetical protein